jgi:hypothetical protein
MSGLVAYFVGERMEKLAEVPPVHRQIIGDNGNYRQYYGNF